jgi:hypothetical protein
MQPEGIAFLIPVRLEECEVPHGMRRWQSVDLFKEGGYERLTLLCLSSGRQCCCRGVEDAEEFAGDVALQAALDLAAGFALGSAACDVLPGCRAAPHAGQGDMWIALFRARSPPRLSRWRTVWPLLAGSGLVPDSAAKAASLRHRPGWENETMTWAG